jgi:flagellar M-ring protein FliF
MAGESDLAGQFRKAFDGMSSAQRMTVGAILLAVLLGLAGLGIWASQESMGVLFSNLPAQDANRIVEELRKQQVRFELSTDQRTILVPESRAGELRLKFAGDGLPRGEAIGFEKLEAPGLTTTDFTQKIMYRRALESTLAHTIKSLQQVAEATVHVTPSNDSPFVSEKEDAKASVLLKLRGSRALPDENTQAIVNLVAASVEGLKPENVVVIDQYSRILSRSGRDPMVGASDTQKKVQRDEEDHLVRRITEMLEPVVGLGKVRATAHVDLDFDKVKVQEETFNPQGQVERSIQSKKEESNKREGSSGAPGTSSNVAPASAAAQGGGTETNKKEETTTNFEISKTQRSVEQAPGMVKRVSLAVVLDHAQTWEKDAKGEPVGKAVPRTPEEIKKIRDQVASAVGIQEKRGDMLTVENIAFASLVNPKEEAEQKSRERWDLINKFLPLVVWTVVGILVLFFIILPMLRRISAALNRPAPLRISEGGEGAMGEGGAPMRKFTPGKSLQEMEAEIEAELNAEGITSAPEAQRRQAIKKRISDTAITDPETVASLVRSWILEDGR